jgi:glutathione S-transferase
MLGEAYTLVDLIVASVIGYSAYIGAPVASHPTTQAWLQKVQARPSMQIEA